MIRRFFLKRLKNYFTILMIPAFVLFVFILFMTASSRIHNIHTASQNALENMDETFDLITANCFYQQDLMTLNPQLSLSLRNIPCSNTRATRSCLFTSFSFNCIAMKLAI